MNPKRIFFILSFFLISHLVLGEDYDFVVAKDGSGDFTSIQEAIDATKAFPPKRMRIFIKNGIYNEKVKVHAWNNKLSLIGEDAEKTIITHSDHFKQIDRGRNSTFHTWTLLVEGDDFIGENFTVTNAAGPVGQALALSVNATRCVFRNCRFLGNQDTVYTAGEGNMQYFDRCYIEGTTDFIFGAATAVFEGCIIHSKSNSFVTAASTPQGQSFGYVFLKCHLTADQGVDKVYLGRPWRTYAKVVFLHSDLGAHIRPEGWEEWGKIISDSTFYFGEYENTGKGASVSGRVKWSYVLTMNQAKRYTLDQIFESACTENKKYKEWWTR